MFDFLGDLIDNISDLFSDGDAPVPSDTPSSAPHSSEVQFGMSSDAGETKDGHPVEWSTAEKAGGQLIDTQTGQEVSKWDLRSRKVINYSICAAIV